MVPNPIQALIAKAPSGDAKAAAPSKATPEKGESGGFNVLLAVLGKQVKALHATAEQLGTSDAASLQQGKSDAKKAEAASPLLVLLAALANVSTANSKGGKKPPVKAGAIAKADATGQAHGAVLPGSGKALPVKDGLAAKTQIFDTSSHQSGLQGSLSGQAHNPVTQKLTAGDLTSSKLLQALTAKSTSDSTVTANAALSALHSALPQQQPQVQFQQVALNQQMGTSAWQQEFSQKVVWLAKNNMQAAKLQLHPEHLGPIEVHIQQVQNQTQVWFHANHAATRAAMQASLPQLQQMFDQQGINLAGAHVLAHGFGPNGGGGQNANGQGASRGEPTSVFHDFHTDAEIGQELAVRVSGLVDAYA